MYEKRYSNNADSERVKLESDVEDSYDIYPHPTVRVVRPSRGLGHGSWKETLSDLTRRKAFLGGLAVLVFILLLSIVIILMAQSRGDDDVKPFSPEDPSTFGLHSYPSTPSGKEISFKQDILKTYQPWMDQLEKALAPYSPDLQKDGYNHCDLRDRKDGEQCYFHISDLGSECQHGKEFGYSTGRPCVLLQLFLPYRPGNVAKDSDSWKTLFGALGTKWNPAFVSVTCDGKTDLDKKYITTSSNDSDVIYSPALGFRANFFPSSFDDPKYLAPLIMVQFRSLRIHHSVTVECIAWAQNKDGILPNKEELYRTEFTLRKD